MENRIEIMRTLDNLPGSGVAYSIIGLIDGWTVPRMKRTHDTYLTDKEMKYRKVKNA